MLRRRMGPSAITPREDGPDWHRISTAALRLGGPKLTVSSKTSVKIGTPPNTLTASAVAQNVKPGTITTSPVRAHRCARAESHVVIFRIILYIARQKKKMSAR